MKYSTKYLFNRSRDSYEPHLTILASRRVIDAKLLLKELSKQRDIVTKEELPVLIKRYQDVEKALEFWRSVLLEE